MTNYRLLTAVNKAVLPPYTCTQNCVYTHEDLISDTGAGGRQGNTAPDRYHLSLISTSSLHKRSTLELYIYICI